MRRVAFIAVLALATTSAAASSAVALTSFVSPSRNIGCIGGPAEVRCDIRVTTATQPTRPASCKQDWGNAYAVRPTGRGRGVCHGDTALPAPGQRGVKVVAYGASIRFGKISCTSRTTGFTCRNPAAHGFTLSRETIRLF